MVKKISKTQANEQIHNFFHEIRHKNPKEVKKIKELAMPHNIKLGDRRKLFCRKCFIPYKNPKIRIKNNIKTTICENCGYVGRWKITNSS